MCIRDRYGFAAVHSSEPVQLDISLLHSVGQLPTSPPSATSKQFSLTGQAAVATHAAHSTGSSLTDTASGSPPHPASASTVIAIKSELRMSASCNDSI